MPSGTACNSKRQKHSWRADQFESPSRDPSTASARWAQSRSHRALGTWIVLGPGMQRDRARRSHGRAGVGPRCRRPAFMKGSGSLLVKGTAPATLCDEPLEREAQARLCEFSWPWRLLSCCRARSPNPSVRPGGGAGRELLEGPDWSPEGSLAFSGPGGLEPVTLGALTGRLSGLLPGSESTSMLGGSSNLSPTLIFRGTRVEEHLPHPLPRSERAQLQSTHQALPIAFKATAAASSTSARG